MRGHEPLIAMRRRGGKPMHAHVQIAADDPLNLWKRWPDSDVSTAEILVSPDETMHRLDLRWAVGLPVVVESEHLQTADRLTHALLIAGADRVITFVWRQTGVGEKARFESLRSTDTKGAN